MVKTPINSELWHIAPGYDPAKAHDYYEKHKHLKGRKKGAAEPPAATRTRVSPTKAKQKAALQKSITNLETKLQELEKSIREKEAVLRRDQAQAKVKARKEKDKPKTAAEKAKAARENEKYRDKHKQELKTKAKQAEAQSGGHKKPGAKKPNDMSIANLKALATRVKGQIAVAKQKLAAL